MEKRKQINIRLDDESEKDLEEIRIKMKKLIGFDLPKSKIIKKALEDLNKSLK